MLTALFAPAIAAAFGWQNVFGFALIPLLATLLVFALLARNAPERPPVKSLADYLRPWATVTAGGSCSSTV